MSSIPAVIDALVAAFRAAPSLSDVEVDDGPLVSDGTAPDRVCVGFDGDPEGTFEAAVSEEAFNDLYGTRGERIEVPCAVIVSRGDTDVREARDRAFQILATVRDLFLADPTLAGPQTQTAVGSTRLTQVQTQNGIEVRLALSVTCETLR